MSRLHAVSMAVASDGAAYLANGLDKPQRWDGQTALAEDAGVTSPSTVCTVAALTTAGTIWGAYKVYCRYVDDAGIPGNFSALTSLTLTTGTKTTGFRYTNVPQPGGRATKTEVWRNTRGQFITYYRDVADAGAVATSVRTDGTLVNQQAIRYLTPEGWPNAMRFTQPPDWASVVESYQNRSWWGVPVDYDVGDCTASTTTTYVRITGARLTQQMVGRTLFASGLKGTKISSVDSNTSLTLTAKPAVGFGSVGNWYSISTSAAKQNTVQFSEADEPESCPTTNALTLQEDGDRLTGELALGPYLFLLKQRHIYQVSTAGDPRRDAIAMLAAKRGCLNQRCFAKVQGAAFILDQQGCYLFDGSEPVSVSSAIEDWWRERVNWSASRWFHLEHSPEEHTIRCIVAVDEDWWPQDVFAFDYQLGQWHHERYPYKLGASALVPIDGQDRALVAMENSVAVISEGVLDGPSPGLGAHDKTLLSVSQTTRGTVTAADTTTITASAADLDFSKWHASPQSVGAPLYVLDADGDYQARRIASINATSTTITVQNAFGTTPAVGNRFQIGGIQYEAKWGAFSLPEEEVQQTRRILLRFKPLSRTGKVNVRKYFNHSTVVETAHIAYSDNVGMEVKAGSGNMQFNLERDEGVLQTRFDDGFDPSGPAQRSIEVELKGVSGEQRAEFYELRIDGVER
jgi:hypothetical protein